MREYLVFTLTATLAAMGGPAGHERRGSETWPGRSAILGLLAAALGIRRNGDFSAFDPLGLAVAVFEQGDYLRDWHTVQTVPSTAVKKPQSRPQALAAGAATQKLNTAITKRDYRVSPLYGVAVWNGELENLCRALKEPVFALYLGRKSCTLAFPVTPRIVSAAGPAEALAHVKLPSWRQGATARILAVSPEALSEGQADRIEMRYDEPTDRKAWHFAARREAIMSVEIRPGDAE